MRLLRVEAKNVFSIEHLTLVLADQGLVLIAGENGVGKSSLANKSILWGLYGSTAGGLTADEVVNRNTEVLTKSYVMVDFLGVDGQAYQIKRSRKPRAQLTLLCVTDGKNLTRRQQTETQDLINQLLGRDFKAFLQTDFMGQGREQSFLSLTPKAQKEILEQILPIQYLNKWAAKAKVESKGLGRAKDTLASKTDEVTGAWKYANNQLEGHEISVLSWIAGNTTEIESCEASIAEVQQALEPLQESLLVKQQEQDRLGAPPEASDIHTAKAFLTELEQWTEGQRAEGRMHKNSEMEWRTQLAALQAKIQPACGTTCPTCGQTMPNAAHEEHVRVQQEYEQQIVHAQISLQESLAQIQTTDTAVETGTGKIKEAQTSLDTLHARVAAHHAVAAEISDITSRVQGSDLAQLQAKLELLTNAENPYISTVAEGEAKVAELLEEYTALAARVEKFTGLIKTLNFWAEAFTHDFRFFMLDKACPFLEARVTANLQKLSSTQLHATFSTSKTLKSGDVKPEFDVQVWSDTGGSGFDSLSGGEQQILSFAVGIALADLAETQVGGASSVLILDEPFVYLDGKNSENLVSYLTASERETTILISNDENLKSLIPNVIRVTKDAAGQTLLSA